ncbi:hypothetical protein P43SY_010154 [Pythium insidiosum]|uniref:Protein kinase domain-containing protein n=1 Tax=Pythium insidiosum TaxID=114742 RepID=A0AAD5LH93_PYTIN|nr:hypothetical protein P43SY_010154 [Pythium insidiosum]
MSMFLRDPTFPCPAVPTVTVDCGLFNNEAVRGCALVPIDLSTNTPVKRRCEISQSCFQLQAARTMTCESLKIAHVQSYPATIEQLQLNFNRIREFKPSIPSGQRLMQLDLSYNNISTLKFAPGLANVITLDVSNNPITSSQVIVGGVSTLRAYNVSLSSLAALQLPPSIQTLINSLENIDFSAAPQLTMLDFIDNQITQIVGVTLPPRLQELHLAPSKLSCFIIRERDVAVLSQLSNFSVGSVTQSECDPAIAQGAKRTSVKILGRSYDVSVLDDATFQSRFLGAEPTQAAATPPAKRGMSPTSIAFIVLGAFAIFVLAVVFARVRQRRKRHSRRSRLSAAETELYDVRSDAEMARYRLPQHALKPVRELGHGAHGVVYLATLFGHEHVVAKYLRPEHLQHERAVARFMGEIRLGARLEHPKIVVFRGVAWSTLSDLAIVMEYMPHGDLSALLARMRDTPGHREAFDWRKGPEAVGRRSKLAIALDVAQALVYLHSQRPPVIHRDLKASNVLLGASWNAKLTDFGVSREAGDDAMTAEIGTVAWIAPEVLLGGRYSEKADVYSLGVLLSELDTCEKPFAQGIALSGGWLCEPSNARIALAVSEGGARPALHADCPPEIRSLVAQCFLADASLRPSAVDVENALLQRLRDHADP